MADVKWIKLSTGLPDNKKLKQIRKLPNGDTIALLWVFIMCLAGDVNDDGYIYFTKEIPYTDEMLAEEFRMDINTVRLGLSTFEKFGMIEIIDNFIMLSTWEKWQSTDKLSEIREYNRVKQAESRARKKQKLLEATNVNDKSMTSQPCQDTDIDIEVDTDTEQDKEITKVSTKVDTYVEPDILEVMDTWNAMAWQNGLSQISKISKDMTRYKNLKARLKEFSKEDIIAAIKTFENSPLLLGKKTDWQADFDWFVKKSNFIKVHEGNYIDRKRPQQEGRLDWIDGINYTDHN